MEPFAAHVTPDPRRTPRSEPRPAAEPFRHHRGPVTAVAGIPGRRALVSVGYDGAVALVDRDAGRFELLGYHAHLVNHVAVDAAGRTAATSSSDYTVRLWDLDTRRVERVLRGHFDDVNGFAFVDARTGASASHDFRVYVWDLGTGAVRHVLVGHEKYAMSVDAGDGLVYSAGDDMTVRQWDAASGRLLRTWGPFATETDSCAVDPGRGLLALGGDDGRIRLFDVATGAAGRVVDAHRSGIKKMAISPTTGDLLSAAYDQRIVIWSALTHTPKAELERHPATWERSLAFSPDGTEVLGGTFDGTVVVWDARTGRLTAEIGADEPASGNACLNDVAADGAGGIVLAADDGRVRLATLAPEGAQLLDAAAPRSGRVLMNAVAWQPGTGRVLAGTHDQRLQAFRVASSLLVPEGETVVGEGPINCIRIARAARGGDAFVACYSGAVVRVSRDGVVRDRLRLHDGAVKALRLHPSEALAVSCSADGAVKAWTPDGTVVRGFRAHVAIADDVDLDPTGRLLASVSRDFTLRVFEIASGLLVASHTLGQRSPKCVCFWDERTVVTGNYWGRLSRFCLETGRVVHADVAANGISALARSGPYLVAVSYDGCAYLVAPADLRVAAVLRLMTQRPRPEPDAS
jgi:WD40 repeat protein